VTACEAIGWSSGTCVSIVPVAALASATEHHLHVTASTVDRAGAPIGP
jgi:hypothetical protein